MKTIASIIFLICIFVLSGCNSEISQTVETQSTTNSDTVTNEPSNSLVDSKPTTNGELFEFVIDKWKHNMAADLYEYADSELTNLLNKNDFSYLFDSLSCLGGELKSFSGLQSTVADGIDTYSAKLDFDNITVDVSISFRNLKISAFIRNVHFKNEFEMRHDDDIVERYFVLENDGYKLNAVYTYVNDGESHPAVLLIAGSGPSDYNETLGILTPFEDIALGLAENGICSLRFDKRTLNHASEFNVQAGIQEEYFSDCNAAIDYLRAQNISELYLLGHSLGGQIAAELAAENSNIDGMILFNSSARHLADIMCSQYSAIYPVNKATYIGYADAAKGATESSAKGYYYYGVSDYYWASYNQIDTVNNIIDANIKTLIINSTNDNQIFDEDINMWSTLSDAVENVSISVYSDISHFGYRVDTAEPTFMYKKMDFPPELILEFKEFITIKR